MTAPDRDQQQAAESPEVMIGDVIDLVYENRPAAALRLMDAALAAARADEAARYEMLRAGVEALLSEVEAKPPSGVVIPRVDIVRRLREALRAGLPSEDGQ